MITAALVSMLPTLIVLTLLIIIIKVLRDVSIMDNLRALLFGMLIVIPATYTMQLLGMILTMLIPGTIPLLVFSLLSVINEELFKYLAILKTCKREHLYSSSIFIGGGFALFETLFYQLGSAETAVLRAFTALPLHMVTALLLAFSIKKGRRVLTLLPCIIHFLYNLIIH